MCIKHNCFFVPSSSTPSLPSSTRQVLHKSNTRVHTKISNMRHLYHIMFITFQSYVLNGNRRKICISTSRFELRVCVDEIIWSLKRVWNRRVNTHFPIIFDQLNFSLKRDEEKINSAQARGRGERGGEEEIGSIGNSRKNSIAPLGMVVMAMAVAVVAESSVGCVAIDDKAARGVNIYINVEVIYLRCFFIIVNKTMGRKKL